MRQHRDIYRINGDIYRAALALQAQFPGGSPAETRSWEAAQSYAKKAFHARDSSAQEFWNFTADFLYWRECDAGRFDLVLIEK